MGSDDDSTMSFTFLNPRTVEEPIQSFHGFPETSKLNESRNNNRFHEKVPLDTENENVNRQIEEFEESPNPSPVIERDEGSGSIPAPTPTPSVIYHTFSIHVLSLLMAFSVLGTLARLGLRALATYPNQSIFSLAWVQAVGCLVMGFALGIREPLTKFYGPLFTGITTGFCGSLTTFSSWQEDVFAAWSNEGGTSKLWIYNASHK